MIVNNVTDLTAGVIVVCTLLVYYKFSYSMNNYSY